jgi:hypothetical protein
MPEYRRVFKYGVEVGENRLSLPVDAEVVHIGEQEGRLNLWALVDTKAPSETREFVIAGTGWSLDSYGEIEYWGSVQVGLFVWHAFERVASNVK